MQQPSVRRFPEGLSRSIISGMLSGPRLQGIILGMVGIGLGLCALKVTSLPSRLAPLFLMAVFCPFIIMIVKDVRRLLLLVIILDIPFQLDVHFFYQERAASLGAIGGLNLSITTVCLVILYSYSVARFFIRGISLPPHLFRTSLPLATYLALVILSVVSTHVLSLSLFEVGLLVQMFLLYLYIVSTVKTREDVLFLVTLLLISLILQSSVMIALRFAGHDFQFAGIVARIDPGMRVGGTVGSPNNAAAFLQMLLVPALCISLSRLGWGYRWLAFVAFALGSIALVLTFSRGGWLSFLASLTIFCLLAWQRGWLSRSFVFTLAGLAMVLSLIFLNTFISRLFGDDAGAAYSRIPLMKLAIRMIADFPLLGVGANNFIVMIERYAKGELAWAWLYLVHNKYLLIAAETGIGALAAFIWFLLSTLRRGWLCTKTNDSLLAPIALAFVAAITGNMIHMLVDILHSRPAVQQLWLAAGLIAAMYSIACKEKSLGKSGEYSRYHTVQERGELQLK